MRKERGGLSVDQVMRVRELERKNGRPKKCVAVLKLDNAILKEAASGNY